MWRPGSGSGPRAWEAKQRAEQEERTKEAAARHRAELAKVTAECEERVLEAGRELELARSAQSSLEFSLTQGFERKARAKDESAEMIHQELSRLQVGAEARTRTQKCNPGPDRDSIPVPTIALTRTLTMPLNLTCRRAWRRWALSSRAVPRRWRASD